ncbi:MAG: hypothetical protein IMZ61_14015 [Planctomycetes bacterium]|nr:hypothetical protein [Planctomycetota bacterium]
MQISLCYSDLAVDDNAGCMQITEAFETMPQVGHCIVLKSGGTYTVVSITWFQNIRMEMIPVLYLRLDETD